MKELCICRIRKSFDWDKEEIYWKLNFQNKIYDKSEGMKIIIGLNRVFGEYIF